MAVSAETYRQMIEGLTAVENGLAGTPESLLALPAPIRNQIDETAGSLFGVIIMNCIQQKIIPRPWLNSMFQEHTIEARRIATEIGADPAVWSEENMLVAAVPNDPKTHVVGMIIVRLNAQKMRDYLQSLLNSSVSN